MVLFLLGLFILLPLLLILLFRFVPVPVTPQMILYAVTGRTVSNHWVAYSQISPSLGRAVIGSEDQRFCTHHGFDWDAINKAMANNDRGRHVHGASTISQQTARTIFLLPVRNWIRKGMEAYLTVFLEALWPKQRILTAYLNLVDWGHGNFGAEAAARAYFHSSAGALTRAQSARLAAILPDPDKWSAAAPGRYVAGRARTLVGQESVVTRDGLDFCVH